MQALQTKKRGAQSRAVSTLDPSKPLIGVPPELAAAPAKARPTARRTRKAQAKQPPAELPRFFQAEDVAKMTGLNVATVRRALREGRLAGAHQGKNYIISAPDLAAWYTSNGGKSAGL